MSESASNVLRFEDRHRISDFYLPLVTVDGSGSETDFEVSELDFKNAYAYTGSSVAKRLYDGSDAKLLKWLIDIYVKSDKELRTRANFRLEHDGVMFRAHREQTVAGYEIALRAVPPVAPTLEDLQMDPRLRTLLMSNQLLYGGLVMVAAVNGQGKTTTISSTVVSRLTKFGGHCNAVEDPPEIPIHGWHGEGRCVQIPVMTRPGAMPGTGYGEALVNVRRFFPAMTGGGTILMIGEVRNAETAAETLLAASEGHLVITTFHGSSVSHAIMRFLALAAEKLGDRVARDLMASTLKLCAHQKLKLHENIEGWRRGELSADILVVSGATSRAGAAIRDSEADSGKILAQMNEQRTALAKIPTEEAWLKANAGNIASTLDRSDSR